MALRPIRPEERALIEHLLRLLKRNHRYAIPPEVENLGETGIQLSSKGEHTTDLIEADYRDADGQDVVITLSANQYDALYDLDIWKADFSPLKQYPEPDKVKGGKDDAAGKKPRKS